MKNISQLFQKATWEDWHGRQQSVPDPLQKIAKAFVLLQAKRYAADYNNRQEWDVSDVKELLALTNEAFSDWDAIRSDPMAGNYLLAMLLKKR